MKQTMLLQQRIGNDTISMTSNSSPILIAEGSPSYENISPATCMCINFLRSGCPSAQILYTEYEEEDQRFDKGAKIFFSVLREILSKISLPHEVFKVTENGPVALITRKRFMTDEELKRKIQSSLE